MRRPTTALTQPTGGLRIDPSDTAPGLDFRQVLDGLPDGVLVLDREQRVVYANPCAQTRIGLSLDELVGLEFPLLDTTGRPSSTVLCVGGAPRPLAVVAQPIPGHPEGWFTAVVRDVLQIGVDRDQILESLMRDELTGLLNRRGLKFAIDQIQRNRAGDPSSYALLMLDVDHLKAINDHYGHSEGDHAIRETGRLLRQALRASDAVVRYGGDEFVALLPGVQRRGFDQIRRRLVRILDDYNQTSRNPYRLSFSVGSAFVRDAAVIPLDRLLAEADDSMYRQKQRQNRPTHAVVVATHDRPERPEAN